MDLKGFLNPKSMLTPGIAGSLIMLMANTLWVQFMFPQKWTGLFLSYLIAGLIITKYKGDLVEKCIYFILNGLIIFSLALGTNVYGKKVITEADVEAATSAGRGAHEYRSYHYHPGGGGYGAGSSSYPIESEPATKERNFFDSWLQ